MAMPATNTAGCTGGPDATPRRSSLRIDANDACAELFSTGYVTDSAVPCTLTGHEKPRIRLDNLYGNKVSKTPVSFLIEFYENPGGISYEVQTNADAAVSIWAGNSNIRIIRVLWHGSLVEVRAGRRPGSGSKLVLIAVPDDLPAQQHLTPIRAYISHVDGGRLAAISPGRSTRP